MKPRDKTMTKPRFTLLASLSAIAVAGIASAELPIPQSGDVLSMYKKIGEWTIYADETRGSCLAERVDSENNVMQMGITQDGGFGYVGVFTTAELDVEDSQKIAIGVDGEIFVGDTHGIRSKQIKGGSHSGGYIVTNNPDLVNAIANGQILVAFPERTGAFIVDLTGTKAAIAEIRACTDGLSA
jgi:hypothetical protein